jgi:hypothetical protein
MRIFLYRVNRIPYGILITRPKTINGERWQAHMFSIRPKWLADMVLASALRKATKG